MQGCLLWHPGFKWAQTREPYWLLPQCLLVIRDERMHHPRDALRNVAGRPSHPINFAAGAVRPRGDWLDNQTGSHPPPPSLRFVSLLAFTLFPTHFPHHVGCNSVFHHPPASPRHHLHWIATRARQHLATAIAFPRSPGFFSRLSRPLVVAHEALASQREPQRSTLKYKPENTRLGLFTSSRPPTTATTPPRHHDRTGLATPSRPCVSGTPSVTRLLFHHSH